MLRSYSAALMFIRPMLHRRIYATPVVVQDLGGGAFFLAAEGITGVSLTHRHYLGPVFIL